MVGTSGSASNFGTGAAHVSNDAITTINNIGSTGFGYIGGHGGSAEYFGNTLCYRCGVIIMIDKVEKTYKIDEDGTNQGFNNLYKVTFADGTISFVPHFKKKQTLSKNIRMAKNRW